MHIHLPKPLHGWKEFGNEIFVIVLGVLIALGFEQVVEELHWQHKVREGEERLEEELQENYKAAVYQIVLSPCKIGELDNMLDRVLRSGARLEPAPLLPPSQVTAFVGHSGDVYNTIIRAMDSPVWESLQLDGTTAHMPVSTQRILGKAYRQMEANKLQFRSLPDLTELSHPLPLDAGTRRALVAEIETAKRIRIKMALSAAQAAARIRDIGYAPEPSLVDGYITTVAKEQLAQCKSEGHPLADWKRVVLDQTTPG